MPFRTYRDVPFTHVTTKNAVENVLRVTVVVAREIQIIVIRGLRVIAVGIDPRCRRLGV